jgi:carbon monoxide dehydrogenase subunit G
MEMSNTRIVPAPQEKVWKALNDPDTLKACIPGCESIEKISDNEYAVTMTAKVGPVSAKFKGKLRLADLNPPNSYTLTFEGQGGAAGFGKGTAKVSLVPEGTGTLINYTVNAQVGGKLAQVGSRLIDGAAKKMADDFFAAFATRIGAPQADTATAQAVSLDKAGMASGGNRVWLWAAVAVGVVVILYFIAR